jgi:rubrerythrin
VVERRIVSRGDAIPTAPTEWVCQICGEPVRVAERPAVCPCCQASAERFSLQEQSPGS